MRCRNRPFARFLTVQLLPDAGSIPGRVGSLPITSKAVQVHGAFGISTEFPVERYFRSARLLTIPDGTTQTTAASAGGTAGTVFYTRCPWTGENAESISDCTPPSCPTNWSDLGITGLVKTAASPGAGGYAADNNYSESAGYQERTCAL